MTYSTIKRKPCRIGGCNRMPIFGGAGFCFEHQPQEVILKKQEQRQKGIKKRNARLNDAAKLRKLDREVNGQSELDLWFALKMSISPKVCENCGKSLAHLNLWEWRGSQHHIVEKSKINGVPEVATNIYNHMVLGYYCCHPIWHQSQEAASKMKCFPEAQRRFKLFKDEIPFNKMRKVNVYLIYEYWGIAENITIPPQN